MPASFLAVMVTLIMLAGCGGGGGGGTSGAGATGSVAGTSSSNAGVEPVTRVEINFDANQVASRSSSARASAPWYRFSGFDALGNRRYGPVQQARASRVVLEGVPISVVTMLLEELDDAGEPSHVLRSTLSLTASTTAVIQDPEHNAPHLAGLTVTPAQANIVAGTRQQYRATGTFSDGSTHDLTTEARWQSSDATVAAFDNPGGASGHGDQGIVTARAAGTTTITAIVAQQSSQATLVVTASPVATLTVAPSQWDLPKGLTTPLSVTARFADGTVQDVTAAADWSSSDQTVATVSNTSPTRGLVSGRALGTATITATFGEVQGTARIHVTDPTLVAIAVDPASASIPKGLAQAFTATGHYSDGSTADLTAAATWTSSDQALGTVAGPGAPAGVASAVGEGNCTITAALGSVRGTASMAVTAAVLQTIAITPTDPSVPKGLTTQLTARGTYSDSSVRDLTSQVSWSSDDSQRATVVGGLVTGVAMGDTTVRAGLGGKSAAVSLQVSAATLVGITVTTPSWFVGLGATQALTARGTYSDNTSSDISTLVAWESSAVGVVGVSNADGSRGTASGVTAGTATISASLSGHTGSVLIRALDRTTRISLSSTGAQLTGGTSDNSISADGRFVAFRGDTPDLVPGGYNGKSDVYVRDCLTGAVERVSVASDGTEGNDYSFDPVISADGRYVAFESWSTNLVPAATQPGTSVFVRDRLTGTTERASLTSEGLATYGSYASISADGRYVAFSSYAYPGLVGRYQVFVRDRIAGTTTLVSVPPSGTGAGNGDSIYPSISADGRYVAFQSDATNLVATDTNGQADVLVRDMQANTTVLASVASDGTQGNSASGAPKMAAGGRFVVFTSSATNLVIGDTNGYSDVFVRDLQAGATERVSVATDGGQSNGLPSESLGEFACISGDGRYVVFRTTASNLVTGDTNGYADLVLRDRQTGTTTRISVASDGTQATDSCLYFCISTDGRFVAFASDASNLVESDTNHQTDIFLRRTW